MWRAWIEGCRTLRRNPHARPARGGGHAIPATGAHAIAAGNGSGWRLGG